MIPRRARYVIKDTGSTWADIMLLSCRVLRSPPAEYDFDPQPWNPAFCFRRRLEILTGRPSHLSCSDIISMISIVDLVVALYQLHICVWSAVRQSRHAPMGIFFGRRSPRARNVIVHLHARHKMSCHSLHRRYNTLYLPM
jgi:hypothetical protein